jgi:hypothetical protein
MDAASLGYGAAGRGAIRLTTMPARRPALVAPGVGLVRVAGSGAVVAVPAGRLAGMAGGANAVYNLASDRSDGGTNPAPKGDGISRSEHARIRSKQGRPVGQVVNDAQRAGRRDVFVQSDGRFVVRGPKGREHIIEPNGEHVTSLNRPDSAHVGRLRDGTIRPATEDELRRLKDFVK